MNRTENAAANTHNVVEQLVFDGRTGSDAIVLLDVPCGQGSFSRRAAKHRATVYAGDVEALIATNEAIRFREMDMDRPFPFEEDSFTDIVCIDGIEHIERQFDFVRECNRTLRTGGRLVISTPNLSSVRSRWRYLWTGHHNKGKTPLDEAELSPLHHRSLLSFPELRYLLHTNGFQIETVTTNRVKPIAWVYMAFWPLCYLATQRAYLREEKDPRLRATNRQVFKQMLSRDLFFGETLIVRARKTGPWLTYPATEAPDLAGTR